MTSNNNPNNNSNASLATADNPDWQEALEDVHTRFILNLPPSELTTADRIMFQIEQAWWFYEDCICDVAPPDKRLPRFANFKPFALHLFAYSPLLPHVSSFAQMWSEFSMYKRKISNYGCILLNTAATHVILCQVWNGKSYTFPSGKINQGEHGLEAAARETYEETGFDPHALFGHAAAIKAAGNCTWTCPLQQADALVYQEPAGGKRRTNYVCRGVPEDFPFAPVARKEVSNIAWYPLDALPKPNFAVTPFLPKLHRWIKKNVGGGRKTPRPQHRRDNNGGSSHGRQTPKKNRSTSRQKQQDRDTSSRGRKTPNRSRQRTVRHEQDDLVQAGLAATGDTAGWSEEEMFATNEKLLGRKVTYDGNPHAFVEKGFDGQDPHAFHVVGDGFMNSVVQSLAPPPESSKLQPLFRSGKSNKSKQPNNIDTGGEDELQPFFSEEGATPWGDVVQDVAGLTLSSSTPRTIPASSAVTINPPGGSSILAMLQNTTTLNATPTATAAATMTTQDGTVMDSLFMTDAEITARSQAIKTGQQQNDTTRPVGKTTRAQQYEKELAFVQDWVARLPKPPVTKHFGEFKLDADAIVDQALRRARQEASAM